MLTNQGKVVHNCRVNRSSGHLSGGEVRAIPALLCAILFALVIVAAPTTVRAEFPSFGSFSLGRSDGKPVDPLSKADTSARGKAEAMRMIPRDKLDAQMLARVDHILANTTAFRRLPVKTIQCDPEMYYFLANHPDVVVNTWETLGVTQLSLSELSDGKYKLVDSAGTTGVVDYMYSSPQKHLICCDGVYSGPMFTKPIRGRSLILLTSQYRKAGDDRWYVTCRVDTFLRIESVGVDLIARLLQPLVGHVADANFEQSVAFVSELSRTAEVNHYGLKQLSGELDGVSKENQAEFVAVSGRVEARSDERLVKAMLARNPSLVFDKEHSGMSEASQRAVEEAQSNEQAYRSAYTHPAAQSEQQAEMPETDTQPAHPDYSPQPILSTVAVQPAQSPANLRSTGAMPVMTVSAMSESPANLAAVERSAPAVIAPLRLQPTQPMTQTQSTVQSMAAETGDEPGDQLRQPDGIGVQSDGSAISSFFQSFAQQRAITSAPRSLVSAAQIREPSLTQLPASLPVTHRSGDQSKTPQSGSSFESQFERQPGQQPGQPFESQFERQPTSPPSTPSIRPLPTASGQHQNAAAPVLCAPLTHQSVKTGSTSPNLQR